MNSYKVTVIKTGNSIALRVPKEYAQAAKLTVGDKVSLPLPSHQRSQNRSKIDLIINKLQSMHGYSTIEDPVEWQRTIRNDRQLPNR